MKHYVVMKEVHSLTPPLAGLALPPEKPQLLHTMGSSSAALFCTYRSGPVCAKM